MLRILTQPVQPIAPSFVKVLKYDPKQPRAPKGSGAGGRWVKDVSGGETWVDDPEALARVAEAGKQFSQFLGKQAAKRVRRAAQLAAAEAAPPDPTHARRSDIADVKLAFTRYSGSTEIDNKVVVSDKEVLHSIHVRGAIKKKIQGELAERLRKHPAFADMEPKPPLNLDPVADYVKQKIDLWAETAGDSDPEAGKMQEAVKREFGLVDAEMSHITDNVRVQFFDAQEEARARAFVRAEYERTQEWFAQRGITHVSAFRGMGDEDEALGLGFETVTMQPASSWTTDIDIAMEFGGEQFEPRLLTTRVSVSQVLSSCVTGRGCLAEEEVILLGKPQRARVFDTSGKDIDPEDYDPKDYQRLEARGRKRILATLE